MKSLFFLLALLTMLLPEAVFGQLSVHLQAGPNLAWQQWQLPPGFGEGSKVEPKVMFAAGALVHYAFSEDWAVEAGLLATRRGGRLRQFSEESFGEQEFRQEYQFLYLSLPVGLVYRPFSDHRLGFHFGVAPAAGLSGTYQEATLAGQSGRYHNAPVDFRAPDDDLAGWDAWGYAGLSYPWGKQQLLRTGARLELGFRDNYLIPQVQLYNHAVTLFLALRVFSTPEQ